MAFEDVHLLQAGFMFCHLVSPFADSLLFSAEALQPLLSLPKAVKELFILRKNLLESPVFLLDSGAVPHPESARVAS